MTELQTYPGQPYPTLAPWIDLRDYMEPAEVPQLNFTMTTGRAV